MYWRITKRADHPGWFLMYAGKTVGFLNENFPEPEQLIRILNGDADACEEGIPTLDMNKFKPRSE